ARARAKRFCPFKPLSFAFRHEVVLQILPGSRNDSRSPDKIVATGVTQVSGSQHCCLGLWKVLLDRNDLTTATSLERSGAVIFIVQKILERPYQERAKPSLSLVRAGHRVLLE